MIPKTIHYCWFGGKPLPEDVLECIKSWKRYCPNYEIKEWNESNFNIHLCNYVEEAYSAEKWAFVSDFARFWILYEQGGVYFDTDVELINRIDDLVKKGPFMAEEPYKGKTSRIAAGLVLCAEPKNCFYKDIIEYYETIHFKISEGVYNDETVVTYITEIAKKRGFKGDGTVENIDGITVYPPEYFCPLDAKTGRMAFLSDNTRSIHWYSASWKDKREVAIHNQTINIYKKYPNVIGKIYGYTYESIAKVLYYSKKEGIRNTMRRILRKILKDSR